MPDRFDASSRRALYLARAQAASVGAAQIEPQHMLAGLLRNADSTTLNILRSLEVDLHTLQLDCDAALPLAARSDADLRFSKSARRIADLATTIADEVHCSSAVPYCILLAILREPASGAATLLHHHGVEYASVLAVVRKSLPAE